MPSFTIQLIDDPSNMIVKQGFLQYESHWKIKSIWGPIRKCFVCCMWTSDNGGPSWHRFRPPLILIWDNLLLAIPGNSFPPLLFTWTLCNVRTHYSFIWAANSWSKCTTKWNFNFLTTISPFLLCIFLLVANQIINLAWNESYQKHCLLHNVVALVGIMIYDIKVKCVLNFLFLLKEDFIL